MSKITNQLKEGYLIQLFRWSKFFLLALLLLSGNFVLGQTMGTIQIGSGNQTTSSSGATIPITNYSYSWTQHIISADEYAAAGGVPGQITAIRFKLANVYEPELWNQIAIYMANTDVSSFATTTSFIPFAEFTEHFSGTIVNEPVVDQWYTIEFATPFEYTGGNIVIGIHENAPSWQSQTQFYVYPGGSKRGIIWRSDSGDIDLATHVFSSSNFTCYLVGDDLLPQIQFVSQTIDCMPTFTSSAVTEPYQATISWGAANTNDVSYSWKLVADGAGVDGEAIASGETSDLSVVITGLDPATHYDFYIKTLCAEDQESSWSPKLDFYTLCAPIVNDLFENFDTTQAYSWSAGSFLPICWTSYTSDSWSTVSVYEYDYWSYEIEDDIISAPNFMMLSADTAGSEMYLISPETLNLGNGTKVLKFASRKLYAWVDDPVVIEVGTMTSPTDLSSFTALGDPIELNEFFTEFTREIPVGTTADYFAFRLIAQSWSDKALIDDVSLAAEPPCPSIPLNSLVADPVLINEATLTWQGTASSYDIKLIDLGANEETLIPNITGNTYQLTDLDHTSVYKVFVRSNCEATEEGVGLFSNPKQFKTQTLKPSPWYEPFSSWDNPEGWQTSNVWFNSNAGNYYANAYVSVWNDYASYIITPNIGPILAGDKFTFDYNHYDVDSSYGSALIYISTDAGQTYELFDEIVYNGEDGFQSYSSNLDSYLGEKIKFKIELTLGEDVYGYSFDMDNFYIGSCPLPTLPTVANTENDSFTLVWDANPSSTYEIEYGPVGFIQGAGTLTDLLTNGTVTISGLEGASHYQFFIKENCSDTSSSPWVGRGNALTKCDVFEGAFTENFTGQIIDQGDVSFPICWSAVVEGYGSAYVSSWGETYYYMYNSSSDGGTYLISPETNNLGNGLYLVEFSATSWGSSISVGIMTDPNDTSTYTELDLVPLTNDSQTVYQVYLPEGTADYFAFKVVDGDVSIYNVEYKPLPSCPAPMSVSVNSNFPQSTATVTWISPSVLPAHNFEIEWGVTGFTQGQGTIVEVTGTSYQLQNLVNSTNYSVYVRRICDDENSTWVGPIKFYHDYCLVGHNNVDGQGVSELSIAGQVIDLDEALPNSPAPNYSNLTNQTVSFNAGDEVPLFMNFATGTIDYSAFIWIDLDNNGTFEENELVYFTPDQYTGELTTSFIVDNSGDYVTGSYRMRINTSDYSYQANTPCGIGSWGEAIDLTANITFPCITPTDISVIADFEYALIDWEGQGNTNFELEYGPTGFTQGQGTVIQNVTKPYTLEGLTPGATYDVYVRKNCAGINSDWSASETFYVYCDTPEPTGAGSQTLVEDETLSQLVINGQNLKFYADEELTILLPASTPLTSNGIFHVTQTINCESDGGFVVNVTVKPRIAMPVVAAGQSFCDGGVLGDIVVSTLPETTEVIWYATPTSTTPLSLDTVLVTGNYYVVQTDGDTTSHRLTVPVVVNTTPANLVPQSLHLCGSYTFANLSINNVEGATVKWYASLDANTPIGGNVPVATGTYYVTQSFGACESDRIAFEVAQFEALDKPVAGIQTFCGSGTVADLVANGADGAQILWYASANSINALSPFTALSNGTYYVAQSLNGCFSERRAVAVRVVSLAAPQVTPFTICGGGTISDLYIPAATDVIFKWYLSPSSTDELAQTTELVQGTYYVERVQFGCASARASVQVNIASLPSAPTGPATQSFVQGSTVANIVMDQPNVVWYSTYNDSQNGVNALPSYTPLVNGATYYAVIIGSNGCPSLPFLVKVDVYLSNDEFVKNELKYFPNPVNDILNITYTDRIIQVDVFDILGKRVKTVNTNDTNIEVNLSDLSSGTYMVQLRTETKQQFIKVIKK